MKYLWNKALKKQKETRKNTKSPWQKELLHWVGIKQFFLFSGEWVNKEKIDSFEDIYHYFAGEAIALYLSQQGAELRCDGLAMNMLSAMSIILLDSSMP